MVPSAVAVWFICNRFAAAGVTRVNVEQAAGRDRSSAAPNTRTSDQVSREGQDVQVNRSHMTNITSPIELPRGG